MTDDDDDTTEKYAAWLDDDWHRDVVGHVRPHGAPDTSRCGTCNARPGQAHIGGWWR